MTRPINPVDKKRKLAHKVGSDGRPAPAPPAAKPGRSVRPRPAGADRDAIQNERGGGRQMMDD